MATSGEIRNTYSYPGAAFFSLVLSPDNKYLYVNNNRNLCRLSLPLSGDSTPTTIGEISALINSSGTVLTILTGKSSYNPILATSGFSLTVNGTPLSLGTYIEVTNSTITIPLSAIIEEKQTCLLSYTPGDCTLNGTALSSFSNLLVINNSIVPNPILTTNQPRVI
jgi:hypothetical protein